MNWNIENTNYRPCLQWPEWHIYSGKENFCEKDDYCLITRLQKCDYEKGDYYYTKFSMAMVTSKLTHKDAEKSK